MSFCPSVIISHISFNQLGNVLIEHRFVHQHDEEYDEVKKARRPGRPASAQEDLLKMKVEALEKEYRDGFCRLCHSNTESTR